MEPNDYSIKLVLSDELQFGNKKLVMETIKIPNKPIIIDFTELKMITSFFMSIIFDAIIEHGVKEQKLYFRLKKSYIAELIKKSVDKIQINENITIELV